MAKNTIAYYTKSGRVKSTFCDAPLVITPTTFTLFTAGTEGSKILSIQVLNNSFGSSTTLRFYTNDGSDNLIAEVTGTEITANSDIFSYISLPVNSNGEKYMNIEAGVTIKLITPPSNANDATIFIYAEDY
jgi:hypothetical protein